MTKKHPRDFNSVFKKIPARNRSHGVIPQQISITNDSKYKHSYFWTHHSFKYCQYQSCHKKLHICNM